jgi:lipopolysaccharide export system protein LptC
VTVVVLYLLAAIFNPFSALSNLPSIAKMVISGTRITMDAPRLAGYTRDGRSYELTAAAAAQDLKKPQFIELKGIRAKVEMRDGNVVTVTADNGIYDTKAETVILRDNILVNTSNGTEARLSEAAMDMRKGHVLTDKPVEILLPNGRLDAQQMEVTEAGAVTHFRGGVSMVLRPEDAAQPANRTEPRR